MLNTETKHHKILVISRCSYCPFFETMWYGECGYGGKNIRVDRVNLKGGGVTYPIPEWCPLDNITVLGKET